MRILNINYEYPPIGGGGGISNARVVKELSKYHEIDVVTSHFQGLPRYESKGRVRLYRVPVLARRDKSTASLLSLTSFPPPAILKSLFTLRQREYNVVHSYFAIPSGLAGLIIAKTLGLSHVLTIIGGDIYDPTKPLSPHRYPLLNKVVSYVINHSDRVIAISNDVRQRALDHYRIKGPIEVIGLGLEMPNNAIQREFDRGKASSSNDKFTMVTVGRLVKRKGIGTFIKSLSLLPDQDYRAVIIGEGPEGTELHSLTRSLELEQRVEFTGFISEALKCEHLAQADAFVLPSIHEGFGLVYLEAMQWGLPIVAGSVGGQTDFLTDEETGFLVPPGNPEALAKSIMKLMKERDLCKKIGERNRRIAEDFSVERVASQYDTLYREVLSSHSTSTR